ncbi:MAG: hypothetical protein JEZ06_02745 [Anaerolineaceae bacterium]|nr:hypothetical protein [Anaerolineaceae bacterium]
MNKKKDQLTETEQKKVETCLVDLFGGVPMAWNIWSDGRLACVTHEGKKHFLDAAEWKPMLKPVKVTTNKKPASGKQPANGKKPPAKKNPPAKT